MKRLLIAVLLLFVLAACSPAAEPAPTLAPTNAPATETVPALTPTFTPVSEAPHTCAAIVATALSQTTEACDATERNQACYGNGSIKASLRGSDASFSSPGQRVDLASLESMQLAPMDVDTGVWGVAVLSLQANLPDTLPGQNVTLLIFGNTELRTMDAGDGPQAFYFQSGVGQQLNCTEAPPDGLLVQTPEGAVNVEFKLNNVDIQLGSTAFIEAQPDDSMVVNVIEGKAVVSAQNGTETVPAGARTRIPLDATGMASGQPSAAEPYDPAPLQTLPLRPLQRSITVAPPIAGSNTFAPIGFQIQDSLSQPGEIDKFNFNAQSGQQVYFDGQSSDTNFRWTLTAPDGTAVFENQVIQFDYDTLTLEQAGQYTLSVFGEANVTGDYTFQVWDVPPPQPVSISIVSATTQDMTSGEIETPGVSDVFTFQAEAGQQVYLDGQSDLTDIRWTLIAPDNTVVFENEVVQFDYDALTLEQSGKYTLLVDGLGDTTGKYSFRVLDVPPATPVPISIVSPGTEEATTGVIESPGVTDIYTFQAKAGQQVYFDGQSGDTDIRWTLTAPDGTVLFETQVVQFDYDTFTLEQAGEYTLVVDGLADATGDYSFRLLDVPPATPVPMSIVSATSQEMTAGAIESPGVTDIYKFQAKAGQQVYFDGVADNTNIRWTLTAPDGTALFETQVVQFDYDTFTLEQAGEYTLLVDGLADSIGDYSFRLLDVPVSQPVPVEIAAAGSTQMVNGTITTPGVIATYTFQARASQQIIVTGTADSMNIRWTLTAPDGTVALDTEIFQPENEPVTLEQSGEYTLKIDGLTDATGAYSFQIRAGG